MRGTLHSRVEGSGEPVLVLHGFTGAAESMQPVSEGLRDGWQVVRVDLIGHGDSDAPRDVAAYTMERCTEQVAASLDALEIGAAHVVGYSMGGRVALALATWKPERVRSAILVGASAGIRERDARTERRGADDALAARIECEGLETFVDAWMRLPLFSSQDALGPEALALAREQRLRNRPHGLANSLRGMGAGAQPALHSELGGVRVPICLVAGERDAKFTAIASQLADLLPDARVEVIPGAGHACHVEAPLEFVRIARDFLQEVTHDDATIPPTIPMHAGVHS